VTSPQSSQARSFYAHPLREITKRPQSNDKINLSVRCAKRSTLRSKKGYTDSNTRSLASSKSHPGGGTSIRRILMIWIGLLTTYNDYS
jgi:hypothetical protein